MPTPAANAPTSQAPRETVEQRKRRLEHEERERQNDIARREADADALFRASFPALAQRLLVNVTLHASDLHSAETAERCSAYNADVGALRASIDASVSELRTLLCDVATCDDPAALYSAAENFRCDRHAALSGIVSTLRTGVELAKDLANELAGQPQKLDAAANDVVARVKAELTAIGSGLESQIAHGKNAPAAERQFDLAARMNLNARAAIAAAKNAHALEQGAARNVARLNAAREAAIAELRKHVKNIVQA
jgi:hypothetical protein